MLLAIPFSEITDMRHYLVGILISMVALTLAPGLLQAHAMLDHAEPKVGSETDHPASVKAWFTEELEPAFSTLKVFDASGRQVDANDARLDANDKSLLIVTLPGLAEGRYNVVWEVVAKDTHRTRGHFAFTVKSGT